MNARHASNRRRGFIPAVMALLLLGLVLWGCENKDKGPEFVYSKSDPAEFEFQKGSDRPPTAKTLYSMARILQAQDKRPQQEFVLKRIIELHPDFLPAYCDLAELYLYQRQSHKSIAVLEGGLKQAPDAAILINDLGVVYLAREEYPKALEQFSKAAGLPGADVRYRANMAVALGMMGRYDEALALYEQVLRPSEAHYNLAVLAEARNDQERARREYAVAEQLRKGD